MSRRQYFTITIIILVVFILFQVTGVLKDAWNEYDKNDYAAVSTELRSHGRHQIRVNDASVDENYVVIIGDDGSDSTVNMAKIWCEYGQRDYFLYHTLDDAPENIVEASDFLILDADFLSFPKDASVLMGYASKGVNMVFSSLPAPSLIDGNIQLKILLGIYEVREPSVTIKGVTLFENFLFGGRSIYRPENSVEEKMQDLDLEIPWYTAYSGVKRYMVGILDKDDYGGKDVMKDEDMPVIIWKNSLGDAKIFAVNGGYMEDVTALGIYSAIVFEMSDYLLYPVVNAQNLAVTNFAALSSEYDSKMRELYSRTQKAVFQDIIWPMLCSVFENTGNIPSFFISPKMNYLSEERPDGQSLVFYQRQLREVNAEAGLTLSHDSQTPLSEKLTEDTEFYNENIPQYKFLTLYSKNESDYRSVMQEQCLTDVRTVFFGRNSNAAPLDYISDNVTAQYASVNGFEHTYSDNLKIRSLETCLGYSSIVLDLETIANPQNDDDRWEKQVEKFSSYTNTFWRPFQAFEKTSLSTSDRRIRQFLNMSYKEKREGEEISLQIDKVEDKAYFVLRTHGESIASIAGGTYKKIENNAFLIETSRTYVSIRLKNDTQLMIR